MYSFISLCFIAMAWGQSPNMAPRGVVLNGGILYHQILQAAAAANNRANFSANNDATNPPTHTQYFESVLRHFEHLYNASQFIRKMNHLTDLEDQYLRTKLTTQIDSQFLNRSAFAANHFSECVAPLKNRTRVIVDRANTAMKQCQSLFNDEDEVVSGVKFQLMSKSEYERFRECALNGTDETTRQVALVVDCVNVTMYDGDVARMPLMRFSRCWRDILQGAGEIERLLRLVFAQTDNCIAQIRMRQMQASQQTNRGTPDLPGFMFGTEPANPPPHSRQRRWRNVPHTSSD